MPGPRELIEVAKRELIAGNQYAAIAAVIAAAERLIMPMYLNLGDQSEDDRIDTIGRAVVASQSLCGFCVDDEPGKPERYIEKLRARFPELAVVDQIKGPVPGVVTVRVQPKR